jgi:hypothetical protein
LVNTAVAIFRVNLHWLGVFHMPNIEQMEGGKWDEKKQIGGLEKQMAIQLVPGTRFTNDCDIKVSRCHMVRRTDNPPPAKKKKAKVTSSDISLASI